MKQRGYFVMLGTVLPRADSGWDSTKEAERLAYNTLVRANAAGADAVVDFAADTLMGDAAPPPSSYYHSDNLHPINLGQDRLTVIYQAALNSLLSVNSTRTALVDPITWSGSPSIAYSTGGGGKFGECRTAGSGSTTFMTMPNNRPVPFTAESWVKFTGSALLVAVGQYPSWYIGATAGGFAAASVQSGASRDIISTVDIKSDGLWHHLALVVVTNLSTLYVDGIAAGSVAYHPSGNASQPVSVGSYNSGAFKWLGSIDEVTLFNYAKYTGNFTPPTAPYQIGEPGLLGVFHLDSSGAGER